MFSFLCTIHTRYARVQKRDYNIYVFIFVYDTYEVFVYTAVYMLAADGAVYDTPKKKSMVMR